MINETFASCPGGVNACANILKGFAEFYHLYFFILFSFFIFCENTLPSKGSESFLERNFTAMRASGYCLGFYILEMLQPRGFEFGIFLKHLLPETAPAKFFGN